MTGTVETIEDEDGIQARILLDDGREFQVNFHPGSCQANQKGEPDD